MIYLAHAEYLLLILLIPVFFIMYWIMRKIRKKRMARLGDVQLVGDLSPLVSKRKGWVKLTFLSLALVFFAIGMARPQIGAKLSKKEIKGAEIMVVLDVSNSMLAEDYTPNRLERAKLAVSKLVDGLQEDRIGLIIFAGQSFVQLPITSDYVSAKIFLNSITNESVPVQGTALGEAIRTAARSFTQESENSRAIILITDGENHEDDPVVAAKDAASVGARVFCVGVGSAQGKPIPMNGELLKDENGEIVVTRLDEQTLRQVAEAGNGLYVRAGNAEFGLNPIIEEIRSFEAKQFQSVVFEEYNEQYMYFFAIALLFLLIEFCISDTRNGRNFFKNNRAGTVIVCLLLLPAALMAQDDKKSVRKGNKSFKKGDYNAAEIEYKRGLAEDSTSLFSKYNLANALYKTDSFSEAELYMKNMGDTLKIFSPEMASDYFHNSGNIALKQKKYQEAVDAYKESLRLKPDDMATKENLAYAQKMLKDSQNQQQQNQDNQNQDQQQDNQNQDNQNQQQNQNENQQEQSQQQQEQPKISPQAAQQMLQAIEDKEKQTQEKVRKEKAEKQENKKKKKNW